MLVGRDVLMTKKQGHIYILTMNRPERSNAMSRELRNRFEEELELFDDDPDLWVMILTGAGKSFCSGMDLKEFSEMLDRGESLPVMQPRRKAHPFVATWKPVIAAINGHAHAGGWMMAQRCDLRIAADTATLGVTENRWNLAAPFVGEANLFPTMAIAAEVALMGRPITAQRAYEIGFVNKVVPPDELMDEAIRWAEHLCSLGQEAVRGHKKLLYYGSWAPPSEVWELGKDIFYWMNEGKPGVVVDSTIGSRAFAEGKTPDFSQMFTPKRFICSICGTEYVIAKQGSESPLPVCHDMELVEKKPAGTGEA